VPSPRLKPGKQRYSLLLADDGGVLDDLIVTNRGDDFYVVVNGATKHADIAHIAARLPEGVTLVHLKTTPCWRCRARKRPRAGRAGPGARARCRPHARCLVFMEAAPFLWGVALGVSRSGYTGEDGFEISVRADHVAALADALLAHRRSSRSAWARGIRCGWRPGCRSMAMIFRPISIRSRPTSALPFPRRRAAAGPRRRAHRGCAEGPARRRVGLLIEGRMAAREGAKVLADGRTVGTVTSGGFAPSLERPIAMALSKPRWPCPAPNFPFPCAARRLPPRHFASLPSPPLRAQRSRLMTRYFTADHEWIAVEGDTATVGITDYAQSQLGDITFVELPAVGASLGKGDSASVVDSVKAASDVYAPVSGTVTELNPALEDAPELVNSAPEGEGWLWKMTLSDAAQLDGLMDEAAYAAHVAGL
jgi:aminomethyltransferase